MRIAYLDENANADRDDWTVCSLYRIPRTNMDGMFPMPSSPFSNASRYDD